MSAGGSADGAAAGAVSSTMLLAVGIVGGLLCIYLSGFLGDVIGPVLAGIGAVLAIIWGADAIRRVASYGLGTGVPSIGYMSLPDCSSSFAHCTLYGKHLSDKT